MEKILILTGCSGFIGYNFLQEFVKRERKNYIKIISIDKLGYATEHIKEEYLKLCEQYDIFPINSNIHDICTLKYFVNETLIDILDFASESHVDNSIKTPSIMFKENSLIPAKVIDLFGVNKISKYYHISTDEVYGDIPLDQKGLIDFKTDSPYRPSNPYSASKVAQDAYLEAMARTFGLNVILIRMANQFGPYQYKEKMIPASLHRIFNGETIKVYGEGKNCRQWTYVKDTVKIINDIIYNNIKLEDKKYQIIHLADTNNLLDNNTIANILLTKCKEFNPKIEYITDRPGHDMVYCLSVTKEIQDYYKTSFDIALDETIEYYLKIRKIK